MTNIFKSVLAPAILSILLSAAPVNVLATDFFVKPDGNDTLDGRTIETAFQTIGAAIVAVRDEKAGGMTEDITVNILSGDYVISEPIRLTPVDSGENGYRISYVSMDGPGRARIIGGKKIHNWTQHTGNIWKASVEPLSGEQILHSLYEDGRRARRARHPNYAFDPQYRSARAAYFLANNGTTGTCPDGRDDCDQWILDDFDNFPTTLDFSDNNPLNRFKATFFNRGYHDWLQFTVDIDEILFEGAQVKFMLDLEHNRDVGAGARYYLEGNESFIDTKGEFYFDVGDADPNGDTIYYWPYSGNPNNHAIIMPQTLDIFRLEGTSNQGAGLVRDLTFNGLALEITNALSPTPPWWHLKRGLTDHALIWMQNTENIEVKNCRLKNSGRNGIMMIRHNVNNEVRGCHIEQMGVNGITVCNQFKQAVENGDVNGNHLLTDNLIHDVGQLGHYAAGINVFSSSNNTISHSEIYQSPRYAVTLRGNVTEQYGDTDYSVHPPSENNLFHHLKIYDCGQDSGDLGAVHAAAVSMAFDPKINTFEQITIDNSRAHHSVTDPIKANGIFLDWPGKAVGQIFRNIEITNSQMHPVFTNGLENALESTFDNVSGYVKPSSGASAFYPGFDSALMDYKHIGLTTDFPTEYLSIVDINTFAGWGNRWSWSAHFRKPILLDMNGDGLEDIFLQANVGTITSRLFISNGNGMTGQDIKYIAGWGTDGSWGAQARTAVVMDANGDGLDDLFMQAANGSIVSKLFLSDGEELTGININSYAGWGSNGSWCSPTRRAVVIDVNGDGRDDLFMQANNCSILSKLFIATGNGFVGHDMKSFAGWGTDGSWCGNSRKAIVLNINGDGKDDLFMQGQEGSITSQLFLSTGTGFSRHDMKAYAAWGVDGSWTSRYRTPHVLDVNGDGMDDLFMQNIGSGTSQLFISTDTGLIRHNMATFAGWGNNGSWSAVTRTPHFLDINADGIVDILLQGNRTEIYSPLLLGSGDGFAHTDTKHYFNWGTDSHWSNTNTNIVTLDVDGDGDSEIILQDRDNARDCKLIL